MAWNEPGNNDKDPWKKKDDKNQGPPDLDDLLKDIGNKFGGIFGGKSSKGGSKKGASNVGIAIALIVGILVYAFSGFYTIKEAEKGIVLRFGQYDGTVEPGLRWKWTFAERIIPVDMQTTRDLPASGFMLTKDENVVRVEMQIQYRVVDARDYIFSVTNADDSLSQSLDSALRFVIGDSRMDDILTSGREKVRQDVWKELDDIIAPYNLGLIVVDVNFKDARPPEEVKDAFDDAISAQEDEVRFLREAEAYARGIEPRARGRVKRMEQEAIAYKQQTVLDAEGEVAKFNKLLPEYLAAPEVTRQRMYLSTMESVYANTSKVMVDVEGGNNMMYLPLDKMMQNQSSGQRTLPESQSRANQSINTQSTAPDLSGRADRFNEGRN
ncbi:FtsH protease activity modulator HflK [Colwellia hornerae]|uniref:Protein HflK n=1 Tax=Colwellia hornerae TaxID=89402 RepID=A0A5C6QHP4_9GAMM|nr:FtsH protease activity modulator HflK [Colwellia hornerae]TWX52447.1 FtsH protease activity modulator HflK [Colwellia hornerae]TWX58276.1 FtsH protease activity modulator HflK [Colwellia hornerae]TWX68379.1 FtsH protease activity modulator HflK [Colwellia hornerae]